MAGSLPELTIVLFNTDSSDKLGVGAAAIRHESMKVILDEVLAQNYPNLFVLAQDKINGPKHKILREKLGQVTGPKKSKEHAEVYYTPADGSYDVSYVGDAALDRALKVGYGVEIARLMACVLTPPEIARLTACVLTPPEIARLTACVLTPPEIARLTTCVLTPPEIARLTACVLTPRSGCGRKILLVSWHGPSNRTASDKVKKDCFKRLVRFSKRLRHVKSCELVIVGGDFNLDVDDARSEMNTLNDNNVIDGGEVHASYKTTKDREGKRTKTIDYVVYWSKDSLKIVENVVTCPDYKREEGSRPFNHPIVVYKFVILPLSDWQDDETDLGLARLFATEE